MGVSVQGYTDVCVTHDILQGFRIHPGFCHIRAKGVPAYMRGNFRHLDAINPFEFELASVIVNDSVTREAITRKQQRDLLKFIQEDEHFSRYYDVIYILFHTGLRISEFCGLTVSEIEFGEMRIKVDHQLQRTAQMQYVIEEPKTDKGIRYVPMTEAVAACFRRIIANRKTPKVEPMVEGYAGFLFLDKNDMPMVALHWEKYLEQIGRAHV